jgi:hypothetical protein
VKDLCIYVILNKVKDLCVVRFFVSLRMTVGCHPEQSEGSLRREILRFTQNDEVATVILNGMKDPSRRKILPPM